MTELVLCAKCEKMGHVAFSPIYRFGIDERLYVKEGMKFTVFITLDGCFHLYDIQKEVEIEEFLGVEYRVENRGKTVRRLFCIYRSLEDINIKQQREKLSNWRRMQIHLFGMTPQDRCEATDNVDSIIIPTWIEKEYKERLIQKEKYAKELLARIEEVSTPTNYLKKVKSKRKKK